jgi:hypothetical protein
MRVLTSAVPRQQSEVQQKTKSTQKEKPLDLGAFQKGKGLVLRGGRAPYMFRVSQPCSHNSLNDLDCQSR